MFETLQKCDTENTFGGDLKELDDKTYITFSSTLADFLVAHLRHVGSWFIWRKIVYVATILSIAMIAAVTAGWFFWNIRPDSHAVEIQDSSGVVQYMPMSPPTFSKDYSEPLPPKAPTKSPYAPPGIVPQCSYGPCKPVTPNTSVAPPFPPTHIFSDGSEMYGPFFHQEMQSYTDTLTWVGNILRGLMGTLLAGFSLAALWEMIRGLMRLSFAAKAKFASIENPDVVRKVSVDGLQWEILEASIREAVKARTTVTPSASEPTGSRAGKWLRNVKTRNIIARGESSDEPPTMEKQAWTLFMDSLTNHSELGQQIDPAVSRYLVETQRHLDAFNLDGQSTAMKNELRAQIRAIADTEMQSVVTMLLDALHEPAIKAAQEQSEQLFLEQRRTADAGIAAQIVLDAHSYLVTA